MRLRRIVLIIAITLTLTGCVNADYNLTINKDLSVLENVNISATKEYFDSFYMNLPVTIVEENYNSDWINPLKENNYKYELRKNNYPYPSVFVEKKYNNLNEYSQKTVFLEQSFEDLIIKTNNNLYQIQTVNFLPYVEDQTDEGFPISNLSINIKLPFVVTESNADKIDKSTNTYTWIIDEETKDKEINITFDKSKIYIYNISWYISLIIIIVISIVTLIIVIINVKKNKNNNRVN